MKKILLSIFFVVLTMPVVAKETVTIYYAFGAADNMANYSRTLVEEANRLQDKYTFLFDVKPGAGNAVAANYVKNNPNTILATSSAFFIRPIFYPNESYNPNQFKALLPLADTPMGVASLKYQSWKEVPTNRPVTIGTSGLGVTTHLVALQLASKYPNLTVIPFKNPTDAMIAAAGGQIDLTVGFIKDLMSLTTVDVNASRRLSILGVTGNKTINRIKPLSSQGFTANLTSMNAPQMLVVPVTTPDAKFIEWRSILVRASKAKTVQDSYAFDHASRLDNIGDDNIQPWFYKQGSLWKHLSSGVKLEQ